MLVTTTNEINHKAMNVLELKKKKHNLYILLTSAMFFTF